MPTGEYLFTTTPPFTLGLITFIYFSFLYFGGAYTAQWLGKKYFTASRLPQSKHQPTPNRQQIQREITYSLLSIAIFGLQAIALQTAYKMGWLTIHWDINPFIIFEIIALFLWNEIHFYTCHRLLHIPFLFRHIHRIHHRSITPTPFAIYSFHPIEAFLLGTVMHLAALLYPFNALSLALLPLISILFNLLGHWHYEIFSNQPTHLLAMSTRHSLHHQHPRGNYGFALPYLDKWFKTQNYH